MSRNLVEIMAGQRTQHPELTAAINQVASQPGKQAPRTTVNGHVASPNNSTPNPGSGGAVGRRSHAAPAGAAGAAPAVLLRDLAKRGSALGVRLRGR